jgi:RNA polymerase sigma-70 factor, ECF subfamily
MSKTLAERDAADLEWSETELISRLRDDDHEAFEYVVRRYSPRLLAVARRMLPREEDAQDALQDAFLAAFRNLNRFAGSSLMSTWLHRIVVNACLMKLRTRRRKPEESMDVLLPRFLEDGHHEADVESWDVPTDEALVTRETAATVRRCIARLPDRHRIVLMLRDIEERATDEVAVMLGVTPNAVKVRLHRARMALRTLLADEMVRSGRSTGTATPRHVSRPSSLEPKVSRRRTVPLPFTAAENACAPQLSMAALRP